MELATPAEIESALKTIAWERERDELVKTMQRGNFREALALVNAIGELAERAGHHPDIDIRWNTVTLRLSTHSLGGLSEADFGLARQIDALNS